MLDKKHAIILIHCPDREGLVFHVTDFILKYNGNITYLDQHVDSDENVFFMRIEWEYANFKLNSNDIHSYFSKEVAEVYQMVFQLFFYDQPINMALFVSKQMHCLFDVLSHWYNKDWNIQIPLIVSNHEIAKNIAEKFNIEFHHFKIHKDNKKTQELKQIQLLKDHKINMVVLARYMQILSPHFVEEFKNQIINIHHSFLPAFPGAKPYHSAYQRGVKIIGATSHYVTEDLDQGPIIEQDVERVCHKDSVETMGRIGQDIEKIVLSKALWLHIQRKILIYKNKTIIFD